LVTVHEHVGETYVHSRQFENSYYVYGLLSSFFTFYRAKQRQKDITVGVGKNQDVEFVQLGFGSTIYTASGASNDLDLHCLYLSYFHRSAVLYILKRKDELVYHLQTRTIDH